MEAAILQLLGTIITASAGVAGAYFAVQKGNHERELKEAQREQRQADRLDSIDEKIVRLEKKVDEHNGYAKRFEAIGKDIAEIRTTLEFLRGK